MQRARPRAGRAFRMIDSRRAINARSSAASITLSSPI